MFYTFHPYVVVHPSIGFLLEQLPHEQLPGLQQLMFTYPQLLPPAVSQAFLQSLLFG